MDDAILNGRNQSLLPLKKGAKSEFKYSNSSSSSVAGIVFHLFLCNSSFLANVERRIEKIRS